MKPGSIFIYRLNARVKHAVIILMAVQVVLFCMAFAAALDIMCIILSGTLILSILMIKSYRITVNSQGIFISWFYKGTMIYWRNVREITEKSGSGKHRSSLFIRTADRTVQIKERMVERYSFLLYQINQFAGSQQRNEDTTC